MSEQNKVLNRLKRLQFRATHRGTQELDRLVGGFVKGFLDRNHLLSLETLAELEAFLEISDADLMSWAFQGVLPEEAESLSRPLKQGFLSYTQERRDCA
ncbi:MAG: succinate dehydrogenase assembly factor 2 [bacterium]|nr:succinate dehydrogenase assembly factor 2 [bacterium]